MNLEFENYHSHSCISNFTALPDSPVKYSEYAKTYKERGMHCLFAVEHGNRGDMFECFSLTEKYESEGYELKTIVGTEAYFVPDRTKKDKTNAHLILIAKDQEGTYQLNEILSESYETGKYVRNRIDFDLLQKLDPNRFVCTSACVAGPVGKFGTESEQITKQIADIFGRNFYLEVQAHPQKEQVIHNQKVLYLYHKYGWPLIFATDSHYIRREDKILRDEILRSKGMHYEDEGFDLFLPTAEEAYEMLMAQGVLSEPQIIEAFQNTLMFREFSGVRFDHYKKIPNIFPKKSQTDRDKMYWQLVHDKYEELYGDTEPELKKKELEDIEKNELLPVIDTHTTDYFLDLKAIIDKGSQYGGVITHTGRGSGVSFASNHLLGFTSVNRLRCEVTLFPERFISRDRLEAGSMPDFDLNVAEQEPFQRAGREIFGEYSFLPMIKYDTLKSLAAFRILAKARDLEPSLTNAVAKQLSAYDNDVKNAEDDEKDLIDIEDYVSPEYLPLVKESEDYRGIIIQGAPHPCAHLMVQGDIRRLFGTIVHEPSNGKKEPIRCANVTGVMADSLGYCKMDILIVSCIKLAEEAYKEANVPMPSVQELVRLTQDDKETWDIYAKGLTMGVNQVEQPKSVLKVKEYKPKSISELSAFVAAIRPGFKSMVKRFLAREDFSYGIPILDDTLRTKEMNASWLIYQEHIMSIGNVAGISPTDGYKLIKAISKKKKAVIESNKAQFIKGLEAKDMDEESALQVWQIVEDSASYMFNASHSYCVAGDSLYAAYIKAHYPLQFYRTLMEMYAEKGKKDKISAARTEAFKGFGIEFKMPRFREDNRTYQIDFEHNTITDTLNSAKNMNKTVASKLLNYSHSDYKYFVDLIYALWKDEKIDKTSIEILIKSHYFEEYGGTGMLYHLWKEVYEGVYKLNEKLKSFDERVTALHKIEDKSDPTEELPMFYLVEFEIETYGTPITLYNTPETLYVVTQVEDAYKKVVQLFNLKTGTSGEMRIKKDLFEKRTLKVGDIIRVKAYDKRPDYTYIAGQRKQIPGSQVLWLQDWIVVHDRADAVIPDIAMAEKPQALPKKEEIKNGEQISFLC